MEKGGFFTGCAESISGGLSVLGSVFKNKFFGITSLLIGLGCMGGLIATGNAINTGILKGASTGLLAAFGLGTAVSVLATVAGGKLDNKVTPARKAGRVLAYPILALGLTIGAVSLHHEFNKAIKWHPCQYVGCVNDFNSNAEKAKTSNIYSEVKKFNLV